MPKKKDKKKTKNELGIAWPDGRDDANVFDNNSGSNYSIYILIVAFESAGLSLSTVGKTLELEGSCGHDVVYNISWKLTFAKNGRDDANVFDHNSGFHSSIFILIVALGSAVPFLSRMGKALDLERNCGRDVLYTCTLFWKLTFVKTGAMTRMFLIRPITPVLILWFSFWLLLKDLQAYLHQQ